METKKIEVRHLTLEDYEGLKAVMKAVYPNWEGSHWREREIKKLLSRFPEGQLCILVNEKLVGAALSIIVDYDRFSEEHTYREVTGNYTFNTHDPDDGDVLYGIEVFVHPEFRGLRLGRRLYDARKELCENLNLRGIIFGGRIPNYVKHAHELTPKQYIEKVDRKEIYDPTLSFQLSNDFHVRLVLRGYLPGDEQSHEVGTLMEWNNIYYDPSEKLLNVQKTVVRVGLVQWQMRPHRSLESLLEQVEYFVDAVSGYRCDFMVLPEFFTAPLMAEFNHLSEADAVRQVAKYWQAVQDKLVEFAVSYNVNIIGGSMPMLDGAKLLNVGWFCHRNGTVERYEKLHVTPDEAKVWGMRGGDSLKIFETDCGKVGVLICYDVEFPELPRLLAAEGMKILFVPFMTDTQNGYTRVRNCAMARAIENECYVAIAGSVGNLPKVHNMDIQYAQSAVFTPADFQFPTQGIKAEATPNAEMVLITDLDFELLKELHEVGAVRNLKDRRTDLFEVRFLG